ncbi:ABC transporter substrate-binding protein [Ectobacillus ponti]|uniref:Extracellular solute-binding protein n=1 Tax=Ectobacillus ponti TaxID=2961894 RepID=A0AA41XDA1_9BACI|nr:extracellular solute-binding protein [Ectobacillus ponti]MCP8971330.1 extracellular solute-binding protein [Ectobacillus ponti]
MKKVVPFVITGALAVGALSGCGKSEEKASANGKVKIEFFEYKSEAKATFEALAQKFEEKNPDIDVVVTNPPDATTVLKTRVAKRDIPDVVGMGADIVFSDLVKAGVFTDITKDERLSKIQPAYVQMMKDVTGSEKVYGFPYAANADAVIYNKAIFKELGIEVPKTWDEFIAAAKKVKDAGKTPFYFTFKDAWTTLPAFNVLAANTQGDDFFKKRAEGKTTFAEGYKAAMDKFTQLLEYGHKDMGGKAYNDGNTAFAKGESAMYLQGIWAIPEIKKANPNIDLGVFPYPVTNEAGKSKVVSGVDILMAQSSTSKHPKEAQKFIDFLLSEETAKTYTKEQNSFSALTGVEQQDPTLEGLKESFAKGALADFPDHYVPSAVSLDKVLQEYTQKKDVGAVLKKLDTEWDKVQNRK